ncbi:MAG TPA: hypothetical protein VF810_05260 [Patescibacteria group bacterium]
MSQLTPQLYAQAREYLSPDQDSLLIDIEKVLGKLAEFDHISDYSFIVAPIAKAYEGYLKDFFLKVGLIDKYSYSSDRFRVGKTLNPSLRFKRFSIFQRLSDLHEKGEELAEVLWDAWKYGRNEIFHYFPGNLKKLTRSEAEDRIYLLLVAIVKSGEFLKLHRADKYSMV